MAMTKQEQEFWAIEERALDLWREKQHSAALTPMDEALARADTQGRQDIVLALARTASVIATQHFRASHQLATSAQRDDLLTMLRNIGWTEE
jgi:hypothetical protein